MLLFVGNSLGNCCKGQHDIATHSLIWCLFFFQVSSNLNISPKLESDCAAQQGKNLFWRADTAPQTTTSNRKTDLQNQEVPYVAEKWMLSRFTPWRWAWQTWFGCLIFRVLSYRCWITTWSASLNCMATLSGSKYNTKDYNTKDYNKPSEKKHSNSSKLVVGYWNGAAKHVLHRIIIPGDCPKSHQAAALYRQQCSEIHDVHRDATPTRFCSSESHATNTWRNENTHTNRWHISYRKHDWTQSRA